jgi:ribonuclease HI
MPDFACGVCGKTFAVAEETLAKYPGWTPRFCMQHRSGGRQQTAQRGGFRSSPVRQPVAAAATVAEGSATPPAERGPVVPRRLPPAHAYGSRTFGRGQPEREVLTTDEVLERYTAGPQTGLFTDGSCDPNPGPGGWGVVHVQDGQIVRELCGGDRDTTNNRMEMTALIRALESLPDDAEAIIFSDSELCVKTLTEWAVGWKKAGWSRKGGKPIANLDLVIHAFDVLAEHPNVRLQWIKAHDGSRWNEYADALATKGRRATR